MQGSPAQAAQVPLAGESVGREFLVRVAPLVVAFLAAGYAAAILQHGYVPGSDRPFPLAGVAVPNWHIFWMGLWTGFTMALVGEASGIFALPYSMSILQFSTPSITPTTQILTFLNPIGAVLGFRRTGQWNLDLAKWVCLGGVAGGLVGPFLRVIFFSEPKPFQLLVGLALGFVGIHLLYSVLRPHTPQRAEPGPRASGRIETVGRERRRISIAYRGQSWTLSTPGLFWTGAGVGVIASALGVGGGFLLVPIFVAIYGLPMYVLVAATIPFVIVLSAVGLFTYAVVMPMVTGTAILPEWSWGFFAAAGGVVGSWWAAKTQRWVPESILKSMLGGVTAIAGTLYVVNFFYPLPFKL